jgi:DNA-binding response OmpR family regulator
VIDNLAILHAGLSESEGNSIFLYFSSLGHRVIAAKRISDAKEHLNSENIDLLFLQISEDLRTMEELENIMKQLAFSPAILLCNRRSEEFILNAWHAGAFDILFLPLTTESLDDCLRRYALRFGPRNTQIIAQPSARLSYIAESGEECWATIIGPKFTIGRSSGNHLVLNQPSVSRSHAEISVNDSKCLLTDLNSKHGTWLNSARVHQSMLSDGDQIQLGGPQGISLSFHEPHESNILKTLLGASAFKDEIGLSARGFREVGMLFSAFKALSSTAVLDDLLSLAVDAAIDVTGAERGFIMLKEHDGRLNFRCARSNQKRPLDGSCFQVSQRVPYEVFETGRSIVINDLDLSEEAEEHKATRQLGLRSISCVPLSYVSVSDSGHISEIGHAEIIGVLYVDSPYIGDKVTGVRIDALETLASEAAMAIYNARLYKDSLDKRKMDEQLAIAREIQKALLPIPIRDLGFVRACSQNLPCYEIGGDYFDYFNLESERFGFAIGDVSGKGVPAALLAALMQGSLASQMLLNAPLSITVSNANRNLAQHGSGNRFMTFFLGVIDTEGKLHLC